MVCSRSLDKETADEAFLKRIPACLYYKTQFYRHKEINLEYSQKTFSEGCIPDLDKHSNFLAMQIIFLIGLLL